MNTDLWQVPSYTAQGICDQEERRRYCLCIPVINEGEKIRRQLERAAAAKVHEVVDIVICDGGSNDGSLEESLLRANQIHTLLTKTGPGKLSAQLRMGYAWALQQGYEGVITVDGNGKDNVEAVPQFCAALNEGYDMVQGSRYLPGGQAINTPFIRHWAVKLIHVPVVSYVAKFRYTDTTNGYRAYSAKYLLDARVQPFRDVFMTYELLAYLSVRAPELGMATREIPVTRAYPPKGKTPTKISFFKGNSDLLTTLWQLLRHHFDPA